MGLPVRGSPLFEIRPRQWKAPEPTHVDALLIGSANAIRHGGQQLQRFLGKPVHVVGKTTEKAAKEAGFAIGSVGEGGLQNVLDAVPAPARLLRVAGAEHVPLEAPDGVTVETAIAYESVALPLDRALVEWGERTVILLHSAVAAEHFAAECDRLELDRSHYEIAALGPRIASAAGKGWGAIHVSESPNDAALLAMVKALCQ
nr:uroporphyrinogen-III synthase [Erythrobacter ani]